MRTFRRWTFSRRLLRSSRCAFSASLPEPQRGSLHRESDRSALVAQVGAAAAAHGCRSRRPRELSAISRARARPRRGTPSGGRSCTRARAVIRPSPTSSAARRRGRCEDCHHVLVASPPQPRDRRARAARGALDVVSVPRLLLEVRLTFSEVEKVDDFLPPSRARLTPPHELGPCEGARRTTDRVSSPSSWSSM
jgi:hypothetical protein